VNLGLKREYTNGLSICINARKKIEKETSNWHGNEDGRDSAKSVTSNHYFKCNRTSDVKKGSSSSLSNSGVFLLVFCSDSVLLNIVLIFNSTEYFILLSVRNLNPNTKYHFL